jgi:hypothetical protein
MWARLDDRAWTAARRMRALARLYYVELASGLLSRSVKGHPRRGLVLESNSCSVHGQAVAIAFIGRKTGGRRIRLNDTILY